MVGTPALKCDAAGLVPHTAEMTDAELLVQFLGGEAIEPQEAFHALVARHGPMVLRVCRELLGGDHDAEDAFQATFLALARRSGTISDPRSLPGWLREVAHRIAVRARARAGRRRAMERQAMTRGPARDERAEPGESLSLSELRPVLHEELARLPEKYRIPVILSYLEGRTNKEVAELLGWPVGTVKGRLWRARRMLRSRLRRRGVVPAGARG